jgi:hypothetical protein
MTFIIFKMAMAALLGGNALFPLRVIGAMTLGAPAFDTQSSLLVTTIAALSVHMGLSLLYAAAFWMTARSIPMLRRNRTLLLLAASATGFLLWAVNLYVFAPLFFPWFTDNTLLVEMTARVLFFGFPIGLVLSNTLLPHTAVLRPIEQQRRNVLADARAVSR